MDIWEIVLLGLTGAGKSASGNTIIGGDRDKFKSEMSSVSLTKICRSEHTEVNGQEINVIDTIGLSDTSQLTKDEYKNKMEQIFDCAHEDGIDVFLFLINLNDIFTVEKQNCVKWIQENFGAKALKRTIVLFSHGDLLPVSKEEYFTKNPLLKSVIHQCSGKYCVFNNKNKDRSQVTELLGKVKELIEQNQCRYTKNDYTEIQKCIRAEGAEGGEKKGIYGGAVAGGASAAYFAAKIGVIGATVLGAAVGVATGVAVFAWLCKRKQNEFKKSK